MAAQTPPTADIVTSLGSNGAKARFGVAYLRAICSHAGVGFTETSIDEDVLAIDGKVEFPAAPANIQVKCTGRFRIKGGKTASWPAEQGWWSKWKTSKLPVYFVLLMVDPDVQVKWLNHSDEGTLLRAAAFWVRVDGMSEASSIVVPKAQRLTADTLHSWAAEVEACFTSPG